MNIIGRRYWFYLLSAIIILPGLISLFISPGLQLGVDFTGGTLWEVQFNQETQPSEVRAILADHGMADSVVQTSGENTILIRSKELQAGSETKTAIEQDFTAKFGEFIEPRFESVGPAIGAEIAQRAILAVAMAAIGILLYIWWAFRKVPSPFRYGTSAIIALVHDALFVLGVFSILGKLFNVEIDSLFLTAMLTIIGYSVHDTIVVFDRIRENMGKTAGNVAFETVVNDSILQTIGRSLNTSITLMFPLLALVLFGGVTIRMFGLALLVGIVIGTYSSIFIASGTLVSWQKGEISAPFRRLRSTPATNPS